MQNTTRYSKYGKLYNAKIHFVISPPQSLSPPPSIPTTNKLIDRFLFSEIE